ncbi:MULTISPECIES: ferritin-like domain-containing protein [Psychrobacillus]|uniref:Ferritin-like domain-containing protein n=1 Tax=Psychrobacillus faecigallinarum TaxID=2762235 RepID=A0ABR8RCY1_9BACI|nr:ferritin-like domain-containing protein [Psychrobacillus faecigallinarum]MBD7945537.1 ferritin-like domain-containing protein [Psychrobacillus faecigallinarum]
MFIEKLEQAIKNEYADYHHYMDMYKLTDDPYWKEFIEHVYEDEKSHYEMFQQLYYMLTGSFVQNLQKVPPCTDLKSCAKQSVKDELETAEVYKEMLLQIPIQQAYAPLFCAMHDETEHAIRFSMMYNAL